MITIKTSSWFDKLPPDHFRIGISRGTPRGAGAGYRLYRALAPGVWFNRVGPEEYDHLYRTEILGALNPRKVQQDLLAMAGGRIPVMLCFERPGRGDWCHRALAAEWLHRCLGDPVPEYGFEDLPQEKHPMMLPIKRRTFPDLPGLPF